MRTRSVTHARATLTSNGEKGSIDMVASNNKIENIFDLSRILWVERSDIVVMIISSTHLCC